VGLRGLTNGKSARETPLILRLSPQCGAWRGGCPGDASAIDLPAASRRVRRELRIISLNMLA
jgi:hypothetical protein